MVYTIDNKLYTGSRITIGVHGGTDGEFVVKVDVHWMFAESVTFYCT